MGKRLKLTKGRHKALPYKDAPGFMEALQARTGMSVSVAAEPWIAARRVVFDSTPSVLPGFARTQRFALLELSQGSAFDGAGVEKT